MASASNVHIIDKVYSSLHLLSDKNTNSVDLTEGSLILLGGAAISQDLFIQGNLTVTGTATIGTNSNATKLQGVDISITPPVANDILQYNGISGKWEPTSNVVLSGNLTANNLTVNGTLTYINTTDLSIADNLIVLNANEAGAGVTLLISGIEIDRGTLTNYQIIFDEPTGTTRVGVIGSLQAVATRQDTPIDTGVATWNTAAGRFDTYATLTYDSVLTTLSTTTGIFGGNVTVTGTLFNSTVVASTDYFVTVPVGNGIRMGAASNTLSQPKGLVIGGASNTVSALGATVTGGEFNTASGNYAIAAGGYNNLASGMYSFAAGQSCSANMNHSFALGFSAINNFTGSFCFSDGTGTVTANSAANEFAVRGSGGIKLFTDTNLLPTAGLKIAASGSKWVKHNNSNMDANAVEIQAISVSAAVPTNGQYLMYNGAVWIPTTLSGVFTATWTTFTLTPSTNVTVVPFTLRDARYFSITPGGTYVTVSFDLRMTPIASGDTIEFTGLPFVANTVVGSFVANPVLIQRTSDSNYSVGEISILHGTSILKIKSIYTLGLTYDIRGQISYSI